MKLLSQLKEDDLDIDELTSLVKEATGLIGSCKDKLQNAETDLQTSLDKLN